MNRLALDRVVPSTDPTDYNGPTGPKVKSRSVGPSFRSSPVRREELLFVEGVCMLFTIQFPLADSRRFLDVETHKLNRPPWPTPIPDYHFVRSFGIVRRRWRGGLTGWIGESEVCEAVKALRFDRVARFVDRTGEPLWLGIAFRRFYFDGLAIGKYEVGIVVPDLQESWRDQYGLSEIEDIFFHILHLPVVIRNPAGESIECKLGEAGKYLGRLYTLSTSRVSGLKGLKHPDWWVRACSPVIFVVHDQQEFSDGDKLPFRGKIIPIDKNLLIRLSHQFLWFRGRYLPLWIAREGYFTRHEVRKLRIYLLRLHAERQCLKAILDNISCGRVVPSAATETSEALQEYLNSATRRISILEAKSSDFAETGISEIAYKAEDYVEPGWRDTLLETLERLNVRHNVKKKVLDFANKIEIKELVVGIQHKIEHVNHLDFNMVWNDYSSKIDLQQLSRELSELRVALKDTAKTAEQDCAIEEVASAEVAAKNSEGPAVLRHLSKAGTWVLGVAEKIGTAIAVDAIKAALGMPR